MSRTRCVVALVAVAIIALVLGIGAVSGATGDVAGTTADVPEDALFQQDIDADSIEMEATVGADGDADWRVIYRLDLDSDEDVQAFEELEADIADDPSAYLDPFEDRMQRTAESGETATQREMTVQNFEVTTARTAQPDAEFGVVIFQFEWSAFAATGDGTVQAGDAIDSLFLDEGTSLTFRWDDSLRVDSQTPAAETVTDQRITWRGPQEFDSGQPRAVFVGADGGTSGADALPTTPLLIGALVLVVIGAGLAIYVRRDGETPTTDEPEPETETDATGTQEPPSELLSNEERVLTLVEDNGGRIKQKEVADALDWSAAMTSQVVGDLREEGQIETFRIGRENVLTLPEVDIVPDQEAEEGPANDDGEDSGA